MLIPKCGTSFQNPGLIYIDEHSTHVIASFIQFDAQHGLQVVIKPSHTIMILQVADVRINRFLKQCYCREYTAAMCANAVVKRKFDDKDRISCVVRSVLALKKEQQQSVGCSAKSGLLSGYNDLYKHFVLVMFNVSIPLRDLNLPKLTIPYIQEVLSLRDLSIAPGNPVHIPENSMVNKMRKLRQYAEAGEVSKKFYALEASAEAQNEENDAESLTEITNQVGVDEIVFGVRKLLKLGTAQNIPRGAPGRISTVYGSLASAAD